MKKPEDYYFEVLMGNYDEYECDMVILTEVAFFDHNKYLQYDLGSHNISGEVKRGMINAGFNAHAELAEGCWEAIKGYDNDGLSEKTYVDGMIEQGFIHKPNMTSIATGN